LVRKEVITRMNENDNIILLEPITGYIDSTITYRWLTPYKPGSNLLNISGNFKTFKA
jgi:hypothetical protein